MTPETASASRAAERPPLRRVALPSEHGGWGLTLEPIALGLLIAPSWAGLAVGAAALVGFLFRTPAKLVAVDLRRHRRLARTDMAARVAVVEAVVMIVLVVGATASAGWRWWLPVVAAAPLVAVEMAFEIRSRGRRLVPELCGAVGVAAAAGAVVAASGSASMPLAVGAWLVLASRSIAAIPFVRARIAQRRGTAFVPSTAWSDAVAIIVGAIAVALDARLALGAVAVVIVIVVQRWWRRSPAPAPKVIGVRQMSAGLAVVVATAIGTWL